MVRSDIEDSVHFLRLMNMDKKPYTLDFWWESNQADCAGESGRGVTPSLVQKPVEVFRFEPAPFAGARE